MSASAGLSPGGANDAGLVVTRRDGEFFLHGEFDIGGVRAFEQAFVDHEPVDGVRLNLSELTFLDSSGATALIRLRRRLQDDGQPLELRSPSQRIREVLHVMGLDTVFAIVDQTARETPRSVESVGDCERCGGAIQVVEIRPRAGRGPAITLGRCRECGARYRRSGIVGWIAEKDDES